SCRRYGGEHGGIRSVRPGAAAGAEFRQRRGLSGLPGWNECASRPGERALQLVMTETLRSFMAVLIDAIDVKRRTLFEIDNTPFSCLEAEVNTPTARGGQTLVRLKIRNLLTNAVFEKTFKAGDKFKEPDLQLVPASYLYSDSSGSHFLDQDSYETLTLSEEVIGNAL